MCNFAVNGCDWPGGEGLVARLHALTTL